ncbi:uncharacterized protein LOC18444618 isoform X2 [Amborella trichopoda]|uniref:uncharacterized protein LOC18444618 isoform X2 n=1 Tax=Amborella trichopoda TaxID=13333 RepID=UPI0005D3D66F|nr:uncharacterized protein LOC18444618 isoform X2 [Amborella trichopoda]|eukprot:XP_011627216.1 uncharacterized protein LOC18444618 isoform X2 [Amborella trichopoda]
MLQEIENFLGYLRDFLGGVVREGKPKAEKQVNDLLGHFTDSKVEDLVRDGKVKSELLADKDKVDRDKALKIAGLAFAGYLVLKVMKAFSGGKGSGKTMKAPGRPFRIPRSPFESNPRGYFRQLHSDGL